MFCVSRRNNRDTAEIFAQFIRAKILTRSMDPVRCNENMLPGLPIMTNNSQIVYKIISALGLTVLKIVI